MASSARIEELRKKFEENPRRYFAPLANEYRKAGDIEQAIAICREYLPQQPGHMSGHIVYGQALFEARQVEEARTVFETALSLDPENLIALRHLGDLALLVGDSQGARTWYGRVLEADPRNEEIQAQLASLDQSASSAATPLATASIPAAPAPPPSPVSAKPTPSSAPTVVMSAAKSQPWATVKKPVEQAPVVTAQSPTAEIKLDALPAAAPPAPPQDSEKVQDAPLGLEPTSVPAPAQSAAAATLEIDVPVSESREPPPIDSFSLEGLETTSLGIGPAPGAPPAPPVTEQADQVALLDIGEITAAPVASTLAPSAEPPYVPPAPATPVPEPVPPAPVAPVLEEWTPLPAAPEPIAEEAPAVPESGPFVTETMAELYLQQGHQEEALRVYRALLDQRPQDISLTAKVAALSPPVAPAEHRDAHVGPTIRELLSAIAVRRPGSPSAAPRGNGAPPAPASPGSASESRSPESQPPEPRPAELPQKASASAPADALSALFASTQVAAADEGAATVLAYAFMDLNGLENGTAGSDRISGAPARHATNELSLDAVFRSEAPQSTAPSTFSFDQFFSQRATSEHATQSAAPVAGGRESRDEAVQFTRWLEGLKQR